MAPTTKVMFVNIYRTLLGSLSALSSLQAASTSQQRKEEETNTCKKKSYILAHKIQELQKRKSQLIEKLQNVSLPESEKDLSCESDNSNGDEVQSNKELKSALAYRYELQDKLNVYKLSGVAIVKSYHDNKVLCFTTSFKGVYMESYHLSVQHLSTGNFKVTHHDLPAFIVASGLPDNLKVKDLPSLVRPVRELLAMFVMRREELKVAEASHPEILHVIETSGPIDYICCHLSISHTIKIEITLKYTDLTTLFPTAVSAVPLKKGAGKNTVGLPMEIERELQNIFFKNQLSMAITMATSLLAKHFLVLEGNDHEENTSP